MLTLIWNTDNFKFSMSDRDTQFAVSVSTQFVRARCFSQKYN